MYPGPPNWENIKTGDEPERIWRVRLGRAITVQDPDPASLNETEIAVKEIQLIVSFCRESADVSPEGRLLKFFPTETILSEAKDLGA